MVEFAAILHSLLAVLVILFQLTIATGAPWGELTMGGVHPGVLPKKLRIAAVMQALLVAVTVLIVLVEANLLLPELQTVSKISIWFVVLLYIISSILNLITSSKWERRVGAPVALCMLTCSLTVAVL